MESQIHLEIIDKENGQRSAKELSLQKRFQYIGSDPKTDIILAGAERGVTPKHLQIILEAGGQQPRCKVVNLSATPVPVSNSSQELLERLSAMSVNGGECLRVGAYELIFHLGDSGFNSSFSDPSQAPGPAMVASQFLAPEGAGTNPTRLSGERPAGSSVALRVDLPSRPLTPEDALDGWIYVMNLTQRRDVQVNLRLDGLPAEKFRIGQAPLLYPGAEQNVFLHLEHPQSTSIPPGPLTLTISAEIGDGEEKETIQVSKQVQITPFYRHAIQLVRTH